MPQARSVLCALVGFMGSGKTTVGSLAAERLGVPFLDLDAEIARAQAATIAQLFASQGEPGFRRLERRALEAALDALAEGGILATGGGTFSEPPNRELLRERGAVTVWLDLPLALVEARVPRDGTRPLFEERDARERLFAARQAHYALADLRLDVARLGPGEAADALVRALAEHRHPKTR